ncbi:hypothetical protein [Litorihabitans aurantiacus]|uniref:DUF3137 domain-containing protein n=1 Tax=Litorihabitans aurantiacus TaxID=1930061 RepID=A0AA37XEF9_9MICO|nr:hypothetical protein [Litorihabitans aurantiacus]GMA31786.1 hypothetical protein GCM10025875_17780 [Litorihabitans aurantiacus]
MSQHFFPFALLPVVFFVGMIALGITLAVVGARRRRRRTEALQAYAHARGFAFHLDGSGLEDRFTGDPFGRGRRRRAQQVLEGTVQGRPFIAFDYSYVTSNGKNSTTHHFSVVSVHLGAFVPLLQVRPQNAFGRFFSDAFGTDFRIGYPPFDDAFHVSTNSPEFTADVMTQQVCDTLLATRQRAWRFDGDSLLLFRAGQHEGGEIDAVLSQAVHVLGLVPERVWARARGEAGPTDGVTDAPV